VLGSGNFGITYLAEHISLRRMRAIKEFIPENALREGGATVRPRSGNDQELFDWGLSRFYDEARMLHDMKHPNIVQVTDLFEANGTAYFVMPYLEGGTLREWIDSHPNPSKEQLLEVFIPLLEGLKYVHARDILHRDIKPENIFMTAGGQPQLIDFGAARQAIGVKSKALTQVLTPHYAPFEQYASTGEKTAAMDLYSLAACMYVAITGRLPEESPARMENDTQPRLADTPEYVKQYGHDFLAAIDKALSIWAKDRFQSGADFQKALLGEQTPPLPPQGKKSPLLLIALLAVILCGAGYFFYSSSATRTRTVPQSIPSEVAQPASDMKPQISPQAIAPSAPTTQSSSPTLQQQPTKAIPLPSTYANATAGAVSHPTPSEPAQPSPDLTTQAAAAPGKTTTKQLQAKTIDQPLPQTYTNSIGMEFVLIPSGSFMMGSDKAKDLDAFDGETPQHRVSISKPFYIGKYEVTQKQWRSVMGNNPSEFEGDNNPVERVSWDDVQVFIRKLNQKAGINRYRLPTEAEWEYAARAGSQTKYSFGDDEAQLGRYAWYKLNSGYHSNPVGAKLPNPWGLYDMHGNVLEWVADWDNVNYYRDSPSVDPAGPLSGSFRVFRGGSWNYYAPFCRSADRSSYPPGDQHYNLGFRLALSIPPSNQKADTAGDATQPAAKPSVKQKQPSTAAASKPAPATPEPYPPYPTYEIAPSVPQPQPAKEESASPKAAALPKTYTNSIGMEFVLIPSGSFMMGSDKTQDPDANSDETPRHLVTISKSFYIGKYEVTQKQWRGVMGKNPSYYEGDSNPVESVSWDEVQIFIRKLNKKEGINRYRLPTEAEWEYAARAGSKTRYSFGNNAVQLDHYAWYSKNSYNTTHPVGQKQPNAWGLYDVHGNVQEWVNDRYYENYYHSSPSSDPRGPALASCPIYRGGYWSDSARECRSAYRSSYPHHGGYAGIGFRLALSPEHQ
jgi:formylglycine-generating enzyme required for sulfatase activity